MEDTSSHRVEEDSPVVGTRTATAVEEDTPDDAGTVVGVVDADDAVAPYSQPYHPHSQSRRSMMVCLLCFYYYYDSRVRVLFPSYSHRVLSISVDGSDHLHSFWLWNVRHCLKIVFRVWIGSSPVWLKYVEFPISFPWLGPENVHSCDPDVCGARRQSSVPLPCVRVRACLATVGLRHDVFRPELVNSHSSFCDDLGPRQGHGVAFVSHTLSDYAP
mmetsp:Transcript_35903/g.40383  ORF Transcript_35903/g.40383 Transcript_35903/m.40383 type:complete len:216 (-) Transcript_35903:177-824(-)